MSSILNELNELNKLNENYSDNVLCVSSCDICFEDNTNIFKTKCGCSTHYCFDCMNKMNDSICCVCKNLLYDTINVNKSNGITVYSFALHPDKFQPSGYFNYSFSRIDECILNLD